MSAPEIAIRRGSLYLGRALYERYFAGLETVVLLRRDDDLVILPVRFAAAGGYLLKRRNGAGDRVVTAADFFRSNGIEDHEEHHLAGSWSTDHAGLVVAGLFVR